MTSSVFPGAKESVGLAEQLNNRYGQGALSV